jgi:hypothetical protein
MNHADGVHNRTSPREFKRLVNLLSATDKRALNRLISEDQRAGVKVDMELACRWQTDTVRYQQMYLLVAEISRTTSLWRPHGDRGILERLGMPALQ